MKPGGRSSGIRSAVWSLTQVLMMTAAVGIRFEIERLHVGAVLDGEQVDPRLVGLTADRRPDPICDRHRHFVGLGAVELLIEGVPRLV